MDRYNGDSENAPNPDAAYAWINFMLQPQVAAQICQRLGFATPNRVAVEQLRTSPQQSQLRRIDTAN